MALPVGTVTFLVTDIEGSTGLWERQPKLMQGVIARHDQLLKEAITTAGGALIKGTGDGLQAVFVDAFQAVQAAIVSQRALIGEEWDPAIGQIPVRMALYTGAAEMREGDYYGPVMNRLSRLLSAGHGGQVLVSSATRELVHEGLPEGITLIELGEHRLRDLSRQERVYQLAAPDLRRSFPPLKSLDARPTNLASQPTPFIGREREVMAIGELLIDHGARLVTLSGPGGTGKTRLAIQVAKEILADFADGVFFIDLAPISEAALLPQAIAQDIGVREVGGLTLLEALKAYLAPKQMLLVLDNFEHLVVGAGIVSDLLQSGPNLFCLITSREALNLREERLFPVEGLSYPAEGQSGDAAAFEAVELFVNAARRVRPDFNLAEESAGVLHICRLVEGSPLAIELAASWTKTLDPETIASEIQRNFDFLATRMRNVPDRHRSIHAAFDYSWRLMDESERVSFKRLSVFIGGFGREAAETVAGSSLITLAALADKSLLRRRSDGRYSIHELLRQFGETKLRAKPEEEHHLRQRHAGYYANYFGQHTEALTGDGQLEAIREIRRELENFRIAWRWSLANGAIENIRKSVDSYNLYCDYQGLFQESVEALSEAIRHLDGGEFDRQKQETLGLLCVLAGYGEIRLGRFDRAKEYFRLSQTHYNSLGIQSSGGFSTDPVDGLALLALTTGEYDDAIELSRGVIRRQEQDRNIQELQIAYYILSGALHAQGHLEQALAEAQQALNYSQRSQNRWMRAYILARLGEIARAMKEYDQAQSYFQASYNLKQAFNDPEGMAAALNQLAQTAWLKGNYAEAEEYFRDSHAIYREIGDRGGLVTSLLGLADTARATGDKERPASYLAEALKIALDMGWWPQLLLLLISAGEFWNEVGQPARAAELVSLALHHPSSDHEARKRAQRSLEVARDHLPSEEHIAAVERGAAAELEAVAVTQLQDFENWQPLLARSPVAGSGRVRDQPLVEPLTDREMEVLLLIAEGLTNTEIAERLIIALGTVKSYTSQIYGKLGVRGRVEAVNQARQIGLLG